MASGEIFRYTSYQRFWSILDWIYPPTCGGCGKRGARWCIHCQESSQKILTPICDQCGRPQDDANVCSRCREITPNFNSLRSWAIYQGAIRNAIHQLKYKRNVALGETLARNMISLLARQQWKIDVIVPVPLGATRLKQRGYNQSVLLARPISLKTGIKISTTSMTRIRETHSQVDLKYQDRWQNVHGAFNASRNDFVNTNVLIVDDVVTSGATMDACANALRLAGATNIYGITLARAKF